jgi:hypothetical protein
LTHYPQRGHIRRASMRREGARRVPVASLPSDDLEVVVHASSAPTDAGMRWFASATISGRRGGGDFSATYDYGKRSFATEDEAIRYGEAQARAQLATLVHEHGVPTTAKGPARPSR